MEMEITSTPSLIAASIPASTAESVHPAPVHTLYMATCAPGAIPAAVPAAKPFLEAPAPQKVSIKLDFTRPFEAHNIAEFTLLPAGDTTNVTWSMRGPVPFFAKIIHVFMNMDKMVGGQFDEGLGNLKAAAEK